MNLHPNENTDCSETTALIFISDNLAVPIPKTTISINLSVAIPQPEVSPDLTAPLIHLLMLADSSQATIEVEDADQIV
jgi:hypothetical protein